MQLRGGRIRYAIRRLFSAERPLQIRAEQAAFENYFKFEIFKLRGYVSALHVQRRQKYAPIAINFEENCEIEI